MPRFLSSVNFWGAAFSPTGWSHTCKTFLSSGSMYAIDLPSGEIFGLVRSGLPKRTSRGIKGGNSAVAELAHNATNIPAAAQRQEDCMLGSFLVEMDTGEL